MCAVLCYHVVVHSCCTAGFCCRLSYIYNCLFSRSACEQLLEETVEKPLWSYIHATQQSFKQLTGSPWPGDADPRVYERVSKVDGQTYKTITMVKGVVGATEEVFSFTNRRQLNIPLDTGTIVFASDRQSRDMFQEVAADERAVFWSPLADMGSHERTDGKPITQTKHHPTPNQHHSKKN